jgi:plasmid rolling circle replication initiator protein Rep
LFTRLLTGIELNKEGRKQRYRVKKEEEEKYIESILSCKNKKINQEARTTTLSLFEKILIVTLIPFNHFPTVRGFLTSL